MHIPIDVFDCCNCGGTLRSRQTSRGTTCRCPLCGQRQVTPGKKMGFFGKLFEVVAFGVEGMPVSFCPFCMTPTPTEGTTCRHCCRDLPPLVG